MKYAIATNVLAVTLCAGTIHAQKNHILLEETTINTSQRTVYETAQHDYCAAVVRGGAPSCIVLSPTNFSANSLYFVALPFGSFSHYDEGTYTSKGLTPEQAKELSARRGPTIKQNVESGFQKTFSNGSPLTDTNPIVQITELKVHPGYEEEVLASLSAQRGTASGMAIYQLVESGDPGRILVMRYVDRFAALDSLAPLHSLSASQERTWREGVLTEHVSVMRFRSDLSVESPETKSKQ